MNILYKLLVFILINALVLGQIRTGPAPVKIGYVGTDIAGYDDWLTEELKEKLLEIFSDLSQEQYIGTQYFNNKIDVNAFYSDINNDSFAKLSDEIDADYFFAGKIENPTTNSSRVMIQGTFYKYNKKSDIISKHDILRYYDQFDLEIENIKESQLNTIKNINQPASLLKAGLFFGAIAIIGILLFTFSAAGISAEGEGNSSTNPPTDN